MLNVDQIENVAASEQYVAAAAGFDNGQPRGAEEAAERRSSRSTPQRDSARADDRHGQGPARRPCRPSSPPLIAQEKKLLDQLGGVPVMGDAQLTADQIAAWFQSTGQRAKLDDGTTIADLAKIYIEEGAAEHVRGDIAFAQSVVETGSFSVAPGNNFAGIGTCDSCEHGYSFPTPRDGVRAQIQLLKSYADPDSVAATLANPPVPRAVLEPGGVRHVLPQGQGAALEPDGQRQLGDGTRLRRERPARSTCG